MCCRLGSERRLSSEYLETFYSLPYIDSSALDSSAVKLAYSDAQDVIDGHHLPEGKVNDPGKRAEIEGDILMLAVSSISFHLFWSLL